MKRKLHDNGLSWVMFGLFLLFLLGQSVAGWKDYNENQLEHGQQPLGYSQYLSTSHFLEGVFENWESEFLQMAAYVMLTVFLFQRGSAESKDPDQPEAVDEDPKGHCRDRNVPWPVRRGGIFLKLYSYSLSIALFAMFIFSFAGHAWSGAASYNEELIQHHQPTVSLIAYMSTAHFWYESLQNWQSEFLAVGAIVVLSIWLRQKGSPESKPVFAPHKQTGTE